MKTIRKAYIILPLSITSILFTSSCVVRPAITVPRAKVKLAPNTHLTVMPIGHRIVNVGKVKYYIHNNRWYNYRGGRYIVAKRPKGYR